MILLALIIIVCILVSQLNKLKKENEELTKKLLKYTSKENEESTPQITNIISNNQEIPKQPILEEKQLDGKEKNKSTERQVKNTLILITGSILIVFSAIVFLLSTWNTIPDVIKTGTLVLLIGVFLGASYIAKKTLKLELTSKAFYYIAMAYIPIVVLAISIFKLFGNFLSITGEGKYIYFSISSILLAILYMIQYIKYDRGALKIFSAIFQILATIFTVLIFSTKIYSIVLGILIYILITNIINKYIDLEQLKLESFDIFYLIILIATTSIAILTTIFKWVIVECTFIDILNFILLTINYYLKNKKDYYIVWNIGLLLTILTIINLEGLTFIPGAKLFIMSLSTIIISTFNYIKNNQIAYKIISYITLNALFLSICQLLEMADFVKYITFLSTIIVILIETLKSDKEIKNYVIVSFIVTFLILNFNLTITTFIALLAAIIIFLVYTKIKQINELSSIIPLLAIIPSVYISDILIFNEMNIKFNIVTSAILILLTLGKSLSKKEMNVYTYFSITYIILTIIAFDINKYVNILMVLVWSILHGSQYKKNDIFKVIGYIDVLILYNTIISDFVSIELTILNLIGYITCTYLISRTVLIKNKDLYKIVEYIITSIIYIYAMSQYSSINDAMVFIVCLLVLVVLGYVKKIGPLFLTSLIAIVINIFMLTDKFWYSIPWWVYMLGIGSALIFFAMKNELNEKNEKGKIKNILKKLKENIDI